MITQIWIIYKITNKINNKVYIGQAADCSKRWYDHYRAVKNNRPTQTVHYAMIKYGLNNFSFEIIASCKTQDDANYIETELVKQYNSFIKNGYGYNATFGGMNAPKTDEWKQKVSKTLSSNLDTFLKRAYEIHKNKYDYSEVIYLSAKTKVKIICNEHGIFYQTPDKHLNQKHGCPKCGDLIAGKSHSTKSSLAFIQKAELVHGDKYNYSNVKYIKATLKIIILCKKHNIMFLQTPNNHLSGYGCPKCGIELNLEKRYGNKNDRTCKTKSSVTPN